MDNKTLLNDMDICIAGDCYFRRCSFFSMGKDCEECMTELIIEVRNNFKNLMEENKRLRNELTATIILTAKDAERIKTECLEKIELDVKAIRADTVREMQERLKAESITIQDHTGKLGSVVLVGTIDQIAKEMLKENKS